jgi:hypothetical protein
VNAPEASISALLELKAALDALPVAGRSFTLVPAPEEKLIIAPASPLVNSVKNDGPELLDQSVGVARQLWLI